MSAESYTPEEAGPKIGKTGYWMRRNAQKKLIPHRKIGREVRFTDADLEEILRMSAVRPAAAKSVPSSSRKPRRKDPGQAGPPPVLLVAKPPKQKRPAA